MAIDNLQVAAEITALHDFFSDWFAAKVPPDDALFEQNIGRRLIPGFFNIQPSGSLSTRQSLIDQIKSGYGSNPEFEISVGNVEIHHHLDDQTVLVTYEEYQRGAKKSATSNARISTALLRQKTGYFEWLSVHETWLPENS